MQQSFGCVLVVALIVAGSLTADLTGSELFPDKNLEAAVRQEVVQKRYNDEPLTIDDIRNISRVVAKGKGLESEKKIHRLVGLENCPSLRLIDLEGHEISDLTPLKDLELLQSVNLAGNRIKDLSPLGALERLQYLHLANNQIVDVKPIAKLRNLNALYLSKNQLQDIDPVAGMSKLWTLYVDGNEVKDIGPLKGLKSLSLLHLAGNQVHDISPLADLQELRFLFLNENELTDINPLLVMAQRDVAGDKRFAPFWYVSLSGNPLSDETENEQVKQLKQLGGRIIYQSGTEEQQKEPAN